MLGVAAADLTETVIEGLSFPVLAEASAGCDEPVDVLTAAPAV